MTSSTTKKARKKATTRRKKIAAQSKAEPVRDLPQKPTWLKGEFMQMPNSKVTDGAISGALVTFLLEVANQLWGFTLAPSATGSLIVLASLGVSYALAERRAK